MESISSLLQNKYTPYIVGGVVVLVGIPIVKRVTKLLFRRRRKLDISKYPRDKVILFIYPRGPYAPNVSPFALKMETYLRMANIPYQSEPGYIRSSKQKVPFIIYDGEEIADTHFCIQHLNRVRGVDLNSWLTDEQRAVARAFQMMTEDHLFWVLTLFAFWYGADDPEVCAFMKVAFPGVPSFALQFLRKKVYSQAYAQGIGRHTKEENLSLGEGDIKAISNFLGKKAFLMGDHPCQEDASVFGLLAQVYWHLPGPVEKLFKGECRNLADYCERMKERFWPDWDEYTTRGGTQKAKK